MAINMTDYDPTRKPPLRYWEALGFLHCPTRIKATGSEKLYRAWGGKNSLELSTKPDRVGQTLSFHKPRTRSEAERDLAVMEYGNQLLWITEFRVIAERPLWVGQVDPGDDSKESGNIPGSQVFLDRDLEQSLFKVRCDRIPNDMAGYAVVLNQDSYPGKVNA